MAPAILRGFPGVSRKQARREQGLPGLIRVYPVPIRTYPGSVGPGGLPPCRSSIVPGRMPLGGDPGYPYRSSILPPPPADYPSLREVLREWAGLSSGAVRGEPQGESTSGGLSSGDSQDRSLIGTKQPKSCVVRSAYLILKYPHPQAPSGLLLPMLGLSGGAVLGGLPRGSHLRWTVLRGCPLGLLGGHSHRGSSEGYPAGHPEDLPEGGVIRRRRGEYTRTVGIPRVPS